MRSMPSFVYESLFWWGLPLVGVPVLIHLINLMRHRRVQWAAMEFLLASQKRHRNSILFKQLLLLLLRMLAVAAVVLMVAQPLVRNQLGRAVRRQQDASHRAAGRQLFDVRPLGRHQRLRTRPSRSWRGWPGRPSTRTRRSSSRCSGSLARDTSAAGTQPDLLERAARRQLPAALEKVLGPLEVSETAAGPLEALEAVDRLPAKGDDEDRVVYLVSDFRANQWQRPAALRKSLARLDASRRAAAPGQLRRRGASEPGDRRAAAGARHARRRRAAVGRSHACGTSARRHATACRCRWKKTATPGRAIVIEEMPAGQAGHAALSGAVCHGRRSMSSSARLASDAVAADNVRSLVRRRAARPSTCW